MFFKIIAFGLLGFGLFLAIFGVIFIVEGFAVGSWNKVNGRVAEVRIRSDTSLRDGDFTRDNSRRFYPEVQYQWTIKGKDYEGSRYALGKTQKKHHTREAARQAAKLFPPGGEVAVYVDPSDPSSAVLDRSPNATFIPLVIGTLFMATGALIYRFKDQLAAQAAQVPPPLTSELGQ